MELTIQNKNWKININYIRYMIINSYINSGIYHNSRGSCQAKIIYIDFEQAYFRWVNEHYWINFY